MNVNVYALFRSGFGHFHKKTYKVLQIYHINLIIRIQHKNSSVVEQTKCITDEIYAENFDCIVWNFMLEFNFGWLVLWTITPLSSIEFEFLQNVFSFFPSSQSATISPIFIGFYVEKFDKWLKIKYCSKKNSRFFILSDKHRLGQTETKFTVNDIKTVSVFVFDCTAICLIALSSGLTILLPK